MTKKPNILFVTSDQQRWDCFGFEHRMVQTPNLDNLALNGTRFSNCTTPCVVCQPARASILTGMLPYTHGVIDNGIDLPEETGRLGFGGTLAKAGYSTALLGKAHLSSKATYAPTGSPECQYSSPDFGEDWNGPYQGFEHVELMVMGHFSRRSPPFHISPMPFVPPVGQHYERWFHSRAKQGEARQLWEQSTDGTGMLAAQTWKSNLPEEWHTSTWVADRTIDYLEQSSTNDRPFCIWASFPDPHHPFDCPAPWNEMYPPDEIDLPRHRKRGFEGRPWWHKQIYGDNEEISPEEFTDGKTGSAAKANQQTDMQLRHMTSNYYGMISLLDKNVGRILSALERLGLTEDTIVIYTSDHGELLGDHGLILKGPTLYEGLSRVGLIVSGPGILRDNCVDDPVSTLDVAATMYDYAGLQTPPGVQSESLRELLETHSGSRDVAYSEWFAGKERYGVDLDLRMVRTKRFKAVFEVLSGDGELYDMQDDPDEVVNRFHDPSFLALREEMHALMRARPGPVLEKELPRVGLN
ncbi:MAG: sulfatase-like hydrolase/transferase [Proteobacteria bacterium]|nr:sulfatase-like hydrolase/transferase [Pseudomonadota bacterium]